jgi:hypothetical protein
MAMYATASDYDLSDNRTLVVELLVFGDLIFRCDYTPIWMISSKCKVSTPIHRILNESASNTSLTSLVACDLTKLDMSEYEYFWSRDFEYAPIELISVLCRIRETYAFKHEAEHFRPHKLDRRWDPIANSIRAQLW